MIDSGDSANREKDNKFQRIKNEVVEMLKTQVPLIESQVLSSFTDLIFKLVFLTGAFG